MTQASYDSPRDLGGRVVVVTGGANGIGAAGVMRLLEDGARLVIGDIDRQAAAALAYAVQVKFGLERFGFCACDVSQESDMTRLLKYAAQRFGRIDCMINNAATGGAFSPLLETTVEDWGRTQQINLRSVFLGTKLAAQMMIDQGGGGSIINVSSIAADSGGAAGAAYSASKAGVSALSRCAAVQLGKHGIRCNTVVPGAIVSPLTHRNIDPEGMLAIAATIQPLPIAGVPESIAPVFSFLASDDSRFISGVTLLIDGGATAAGANLYSGMHPFGNAIRDRARQAGVSSFDSGIRAETASPVDGNLLEALRLAPSGGRRVVLVTGASRGLGLAACREFARLGHTILGCARRADAVEALRREFGPPHRFDQVDVADASAVDAWANALTGAGIVPDLVLNNAAVINSSKQAWRFDAEEIEAILQVNVVGVFNVIRAFTPTMMRARRGVIVNFSSGWGRETAPKVAPYCGTKWAVEGITLAMAQEVPKWLAVVSLHPGIVQTEALRASFKDSASRYPPPDEWARVAVPFLLEIGPEDNGQQLSVPGMTTFRGMGDNLTGWQ